jgi:hypothetical protein
MEEMSNSGYNIVLLLALLALFGYVLTRKK